MALPIRRSELHPHVRAVMKEMGEEDPVAAVRAKAQQVIRDFQNIFNEAPPFDMKALASFRGLTWSNDDPRYSEDSEIAPEGEGVVLRVNQSRPESRQRFSIGHEIGHTLFPDYHLEVRCRRRAGRFSADPMDVLEALCDAAASEFIFPSPWFPGRVASLKISASAVAALAADFLASRDATVRRLVELHSAPLAAVFLSWKLKPTEQRIVNSERNQLRLFDDGGFNPTPMLRVDYAIVNSAFEGRCAGFVPNDKSVPNDGPIHDASVSQLQVDGTCDLDLGTVRGPFSASVLPLYTSEDAMGPTGGCSVVALLTPL